MGIRTSKEVLFSYIERSKITLTPYIIEQPPLLPPRLSSTS